MNATEKKVLDKLKTALNNKPLVSQIILFGSRSRGDAEEFSDMDVLVILEGEVDERTRDFICDSAWDAGYEDGLVVVPLVFSRQEWESDVNQASALGRRVAREGLAI